MTGALVVAIISLCVATVSLTWNVVNYLLSGSRVRVEMKLGAMNPPGVATVDPGGWTGVPEWLGQQGYNIPAVSIIARNVGRAAVDIEKYDIVFDTGNSYGMALSPSWQASIPHRLEAGSRVHWTMELAPVCAIAEMNGYPEGIRARVTLATGRYVHSKIRYAVTAATLSPTTR